ncbi:MAG: PSD1 domain-containing protein [Bryobacterales bacterium]|nr:PSD1 domain-containing protein [Bryobacterales bacterium]
MLKWAVALAVSIGVGYGQSGPDPVQFYKSKVQPLLAGKCYACHTASALGGLRLDSAQAALKGGNSGPALIPGQPNESLLIQVVAHTHAKIKMPPGGRLSDTEIADLRTWVAAGAHFGDMTTPTAAPSNMRDRRDFWSFRPPVKPALPKVQKESWVRTPIDRFILARLEEKGLTPARPADRTALLRRLTLDLTGLPPTPEEYKAFLGDTSAKPLEKVVDRLLASERYGERWGRYWLDVARYADADGISLAPVPFANAWRYRDWVVSAFNQDMPFDTFVKAQIAGDLLDKPGERRLTPGVGYLALGPWFDKIVEPTKARADELQDRIDVVSRGMLGLTVACARCHDHKYDPIPTLDYYALGGVLSSTEYREQPLAPPEVVAAYDKATQRVKTIEEETKRFLDDERKQFRERNAKHSGRYLLAVWEQKRSTARTDSGLDPKLLRKWSEYLNKAHDHSLLRFWPALVRDGTHEQARAAAVEFQQSVDALMEENRKLTEYNERVIEASKKSTDPYDIYCKGCRAETKALPRDKYVFLGDLFDAKRKTDGEERAAGVLYVDDKELETYLDKSAKGRLQRFRNDLAAAKKAVPERYPFLHILADAKQPGDMPQHRRGDPYNLAEIVPRHFLSILGNPTPVSLSSGSGRLDLANAIASPSNPLTARVIVNRIWHHHFGAGLVRTLSNLGAAGDRPSHPELLDYLAVKFIESGWSIKSLHREIVLSATYGMSSNASKEALAKDPDNRLLSRFNRRRLDVEALRDSMLAVSGNLQLLPGGPPSKWDKNFAGRTLYGEVSRFRTERFLTLFDFPDPSIHAEKRVTTNTSVQRLFFLNSDFIQHQAKGLVERVRSASGAGTQNQLQMFYSLLFGRAPEDRELQAANRFLGDNPSGERLNELAQTLLGSNEFIFVD